MLRALLIDRDAAARADLRRKLASAADTVVVAETDSLGRTRTLLARGEYDLVFLGVSRPGAEAFRLMRSVVSTARVVVVSEVEDFAVRAYDADALDYLLKPVLPKRLARCLARARRESQVSPMGDAAKNTTNPSTTCFSSGGRNHVLPTDAITAILAEQNYTTVWLATGQRHLVRRTLRSWEESLTSTLFARASRGVLVNLAHVTHIERKGAKAASLWLVGSGEPVTASNRQATQLRAAFHRQRPA